MEGVMAHENDLSLKATELRLGLPGTEEEEECENEIVSTAKKYKRALPESDDDDEEDCESKANVSPAAKSQIVGWPPVRCYRKNRLLQTRKTDAGDQNGMYVKVSMDGAPYLRKIDLKMYRCYPELLCGLEKMFKLTIGEYSEREGYRGSDYAPAYEDKDGDLMLVGDVPWQMFLSSCKRLRIMRGSEARGLGCGV